MTYIISAYNELTDDISVILRCKNKREAIRVFNAIFKGAGLSKKDITFYDSVKRKIGSITCKDLLKLDYEDN